MARPKIFNKRVSICGWVKPAVKIALNDLSKQTGKSCSELIEAAILRLSSDYILNKPAAEEHKTVDPSQLLSAVNNLLDCRTTLHNS